MIRGLYTAAAGMLSVLTAQDVTANNLANVSAPGFKKSVVSFKNFPDTLVRRLNTDIDPNNGKDTAPTLGIMANGSQISSVKIDFTQGNLTNTGNPLDFAISGKGFFVVQGEKGNLYTRNGDFMLNNKQQLITTDGKPVLSKENNPIDLSKVNIDNLVVDSQGHIMNGKNLVATIKVVDFPDLNTLERAGSTSFMTSAQPVEAKEYSIAHKSLESANSNPIETVISTIEGMRTYESLAKIIKAEDTTLSQAVRSIGKVQ